MTTQSATKSLFESGFILIDGHVGHSPREANLRLHWGVKRSNSDSVYYRFDYSADAIPYPDVDEHRLRTAKAVEGTYTDCLEEWNVWVDNWAMAREGQTLCVKFGNSRSFIKPTSYRLGFHLAQCLQLAKREIRTPRNQQLVLRLERLHSQLVATQEEVVGIFQ